MESLARDWSHLHPLLRFSRSRLPQVHVVLQVEWKKENPSTSLHQVVSKRVSVCVCVSEWVSLWVCELVSLWVSECVTECVSEWVSVCEWVSVWVSMWVVDHSCEWVTKNFNHVSFSLSLSGIRRESSGSRINSASKTDTKSTRDRSSSQSERYHNYSNNITICLSVLNNDDLFLLVIHYV